MAAPLLDHVREERFQKRELCQHVHVKGPARVSTCRRQQREWIDAPSHILSSQIDEQLPRNDASVVDEDRRVADLLSKSVLLGR